MTSLMSHINLGLKLLSQIQDSFFHTHPGDFLLGCTSPDIRAITKVQRHITHFAPLAVSEVGVGTKTLFNTNPGLFLKAEADSPTRVFLAGYINHLTVDESWIIYIYQPYFANRDLFPDDIEANLYDRAVQLDLEKSTKHTNKDIEQAVSDIYISSNTVDLDFVDNKDLKRWREWINEYSGNPFLWDRLHFMMERMYGINDRNRTMVTKFIEEMPTSLETVYKKVPQFKIKEFENTTVVESLRLIKEYLNAS